MATNLNQLFFSFDQFCKKKTSVPVTKKKKKLEKDRVKKILKKIKATKEIKISRLFPQLKYCRLFKNKPLNFKSEQVKIELKELIFIHNNRIKEYYKQYWFQNNIDQELTNFTISPEIY